jgi:hypothetical protein
MNTAIHNEDGKLSTNGLQPYDLKWSSGIFVATGPQACRLVVTAGTAVITDGRDTWVQPQENTHISLQSDVGYFIYGQSDHDCTIVGLEQTRTITSMRQVKIQALHGLFVTDGPHAAHFVVTAGVAVVAGRNKTLLNGLQVLPPRKDNCIHGHNTTISVAVSTTRISFCIEPGFHVKPLELYQGWVYLVCSRHSDLALSVINQTNDTKAVWLDLNNQTSHLLPRYTIGSTDCQFYQTTTRVPEDVLEQLHAVIDRAIQGRSTVVISSGPELFSSLYSSDGKMFALLLRTLRISKVIEEDNDKLRVWTNHFGKVPCQSVRWPQLEDRTHPKRELYSMHDLKKMNGQQPRTSKALTRVSFAVMPVPLPPESCLPLGYKRLLCVGSSRVETNTQCILPGVYGISRPVCGPWMPYITTRPRIQSIDVLVRFDGMDWVFLSGYPGTLPYPVVCLFEESAAVLMPSNTKVD